VNEIELRTAALAEAALAQSDARDAQVRAQKLAQGAVTVTTDRPGEEPTPAQHREWALKQARLNHPPYPMRPGGPAPQDYAIRMPDGSARVVKQSVPPVNHVIGPGEWDAFDRAWQGQRLQAENELLIAMYGERVCRDAGIL
jgi:hypothetical protein